MNQLITQPITDSINQLISARIKWSSTCCSKDDFISTLHPQLVLLQQTRHPQPPAAANWINWQPLMSTGCDRFWLHRCRCDGPIIGANHLPIFFLGAGVRKGSANTCVVCVRRQVGSKPPPAAQPAELDTQEKKKRTEYCALLQWGRGRAEFVPLRQELLSLSLGHTRLHQFIIDANLFRADWWQNFLPFTELVLSFIKGPKLPAN